MPDKIPTRMAVIYVAAPRDDHGYRDLNRFAEGLPNVPGAVRVHANIWLVDLDRALRFIVEFTRAATNNGINFEFYDRVPDPETDSYPQKLAR